MKYNVLRQHLGDKMYVPGDTRDANEAEVKHLVEKGVLAPFEKKAEQPPKNKAERGTSANKGA